MRRACSAPVLVTLGAAAALALAALACAGGEAGGSAAGGELLVDRSGALGGAARARIVDYLGFVRREYGIDYRVVVEPSAAAGSPELAAYDRFRELGAGDSAAGRGLLLWIDPTRELARVEVGYALEPLLTDLDASRMIGDYLAPRYRSEELAAAIEAAVEALVDRVRARRDELAALRGAGAPPASGGSGGGGASEDLGAAPPRFADADVDELRAALGPQPDPRAARDLELALLRRGRYEPGSALYDAAWRRARRPASWSAERLRELARQFDRPYEVAEEGEHAVAWYPDAPANGPTLLRREPGGWVIDASAGARSIVYDYGNDSWYVLDDDGPYLALLQTVLELRRVELRSGRAAWTLRRAQ